jgi:hypothetical protein
MKWELKSIEMWQVHEYLDAGWEPFAITTSTRRQYEGPYEVNVVWVRRQRET